MCPGVQGQAWRTLHLDESQPSFFLSSKGPTHLWGLRQEERETLPQNENCKGLGCGLGAEQPWFRPSTKGKTKNFLSLRQVLGIILFSFLPLSP